MRHIQTYWRVPRRSLTSLPVRSRCPQATSSSLATAISALRVHLGIWSSPLRVGRSIDTRLSLAALKTAIERRNPSACCIHHCDRGSQYAAEFYRDALSNGLVGSMGRRGKSFMKTLKVEAVYPMAFETFQDVAEHLPNFIEEVHNKRRLHSATYLSPRVVEVLDSTPDRRAAIPVISKTAVVPPQPTPAPHWQRTTCGRVRHASSRRPPTAVGMPDLFIMQQ